MLKVHKHKIKIKIFPVITIVKSRPKANIEACEKLYHKTKNGKKIVAGEQIFSCHQLANYA